MHNQALMYLSSKFTATVPRYTQMPCQQQMKFERTKSYVPCICTDSNIYIFLTWTIMKLLLYIFYHLKYFVVNNIAI